MQLNKELEKLRAQQAKDIQELEYLQHDLQRLQNRVGYLEKGEADFFTLVEKILAIPDVLALLPKEDAE